MIGQNKNAGKKTKKETFDRLLQCIFTCTSKYSALLHVKNTRRGEAWVVDKAVSIYRELYLVKVGRVKLTPVKQAPHY